MYWSGIVIECQSTKKAILFYKRKTKRKYQRKALTNKLAMWLMGWERKRPIPSPTQKSGGKKVLFVRTAMMAMKMPEISNRSSNNNNNTSSLSLFLFYWSLSLGLVSSLPPPPWSILYSPTPFSYLMHLPMNGREAANELWRRSAVAGLCWNAALEVPASPLLLKTLPTLSLVLVLFMTQVHTHIYMSVL
jgi:hypothetical protein